MDVQLSQSHPALPEAAALEVAVLLKLGGHVMQAPAAQPGRLHVGFCLDASGSMAGESGVLGLTKLDALKAAVQGGLQLLEGWGSRVTVSAFENAEIALCKAQLLGPSQPANALCAAVEALGTGGGTNTKAAMRPVVDALLAPGATARRLVLVTDGEFNHDSIAACRKLAQRAGEAGIAVWAFATGVSYNEAYLRELVDLGAAGSLFRHVGSLSVLQDVFEEELGAVARSGTSLVDVSMQAGTHGQIVEVLRLTPVQRALIQAPTARMADHLDVLDARGQAYVVRVRCNGLPPGRHQVLQVDLQWTEQGARHTRTLPVQLEVLPAGSVVPAAHAQVVATVLAAHAAQATVLGQGALATQLYAAAGQTQLAGQLAALGTALPGGSEASRALRTEVLGQTRLVALGTAQPAHRGGQP